MISFFGAGGFSIVTRTQTKIVTISKLRMAEPPAQLQTLRDLRYKCQTTELHDACRMGFLQAAQWLVTHAGSSVLTRCVCCGSTALHHACVGGHLDVVR